MAGPTPPLAPPLSPGQSPIWERVPQAGEGGVVYGSDVVSAAGAWHRFLVRPWAAALRRREEAVHDQTNSDWDDLVRGRDGRGHQQILRRGYVRHGGHGWEPSASRWGSADDQPTEYGDDVYTSGCGSRGCAAWWRLGLHAAVGRGPSTTGGGGATSDQSDWDFGFRISDFGLGAALGGFSATAPQE